MTARLGAVAFTVLWSEVIYQYVKIPCTVGQGRVCNTTARASSWPQVVPHWAASGRAISFYSMPWLAPCSGALPMWYTIDLHWENSNLGCPWAPKPHEHLPNTETSTGILLLRSCREGINPSPGNGATCAWTWQFELGNIWCTNKLHAIESNRYHTSLAICAIFSERSEGGQPLGQRIARPRKSTNLTLRKDGWAWEDMMHKQAIHYRRCTGWNTA